MTAGVYQFCFVAHAKQLRGYTTRSRRVCGSGSRNFLHRLRKTPVKVAGLSLDPSLYEDHTARVSSLRLEGDSSNPASGS